MGGILYILFLFIILWEYTGLWGSHWTNNKSAISEGYKVELIYDERKTGRPFRVIADSGKEFNQEFQNSLIAT